MSGIAALLRLDRAPARASAMAAMLDAQRHRGPDGRATFVSGEIALGQSIALRLPEDVDTTTAATNAAIDARIVFDGRIDNRSDLLSFDLPGLPVTRVPSDGEVVLAAYARWGADCVQKLLGDFAFAIWDARAAKLVCARDHFGVRPLYIAVSPHAVRIASEMRALFADGELARRADELSIALFLRDLYTEDDRTLYRGVEPLPAAHVATIDARGVHKQRYWTPPIGRTSSASADAHAEILRERLTEAVRCRLRARDPVAIEVSGGQDSSSVAVVADALAAGGSMPALHLTTLVFPGLACDESTFSRAVAAHLRRPLLEVDPRRSPHALDPLRGLRHRDVYYDPTVTMRLAHHEATARAGVRVTLTGTGSDQLMHRAPIAECCDAFADGRWREAPDALRTWWRRRASPRSLLACALRAAVPSRVERRIWAPREAHRPVFLRRELVAASDQWLLERCDGRGGRSFFDAHLHQLFVTRPELSLTLQLMDRVTASIGCEVRHPFCDVRVAEHLFTVPQRIRAGSGPEWRKPLLRAAMRDRLPAAIVERRDQSEFGPLFDWLLRTHGSKLRSELFGARLAALGVVDPGRARRIFDEHPTKIRDIRNVISLESWLRDLESSGGDDERTEEDRGRDGATPAREGAVREADVDDVRRRPRDDARNGHVGT